MKPLTIVALTFNVGRKSSWHFVSRHDSVHASTMYISVTTSFWCILLPKLHIGEHNWHFKRTFTRSGNRHPVWKRSLPTSFPWLFYRTPLLVAYHFRVPNIDTNWFLRRNKQSGHQQSELAGKSLSWTHRKTMEPLSQVKSYCIINTSTSAKIHESLMG